MNQYNEEQLSDQDRELLQIHHDFICDNVDDNKLDMGTYWDSHGKCGCAIGWMQFIDDPKFNQLDSPIRQHVDTRGYLAASLDVYSSIESFSDWTWKYLFSHFWLFAGDTETYQLNIKYSKQHLLHRMKVAIAGKIPNEHNTSIELLCEQFNQTFRKREQ